MSFENGLEWHYILAKKPYFDWCIFVEILYEGKILELAQIWAFESTGQGLVFFVGWSLHEVFMAFVIGMKFKQFDSSETIAN